MCTYTHYVHTHVHIEKGHNVLSINWSGYLASNTSPMAVSLLPLPYSDRTLILRPLIELTMSAWMKPTHWVLNSSIFQVKASGKETFWPLVREL